MGSPVIYDFLSKPYQQAVIERKQEQRLINFKGAPAIVVGVQDYEELQCLDVQVAIDDIYVRRNNLVLESIILKKQFVSLPNSGGFMIKQPVKVGDPCRLKWSHKDLGQYLDGSGGKVQLNINETGEIEDCWVELDGGTRKNNTKPSVDNFIIEGPETKITIKPAGDVEIITSGTTLLQSSGHTIDAPTTSITGTLEVQGATTLLSTLVTTGVTTSSGGILSPTYAGIGGAPATMSADLILTGDLTQTGTFTVNGVVVNNHDHSSTVPPMGA